MQIETNFSHQDLILPEIVSAPVWKGNAPQRFAVGKRYVPHPQVLNPEGHHQERRHFGTQPGSPSFEFRPSLRKVEPIDHLNDTMVGRHKVVQCYTIVKPKIDRVPKIIPGRPSKEVTLADMLPGKMFLQKY